MGIQSSINSALGTLRVLGALKTGKNYIDQQVQKGAKSLEKATGEVKDTVKESTKEIKGSVDSGAQAVKSAAKGIEEKINPWVDRFGNKWSRQYNLDSKERYEQYRLADKYRSELQRAKDAQASVYAKLNSKQDARESVNSMKDILKGNKNLNGGAN